MSGLLSGERLRFLFRTEQGRIGARDWWQGVGLLAAGLAAMTAGWFAIEPYSSRSLDANAALVAPATIVAYVYVTLFALAIMLASASFVMLSGKRLRDLGRSTSMAGLVPFAALLDGSMHWLQPRVADVMSRGWVYSVDALTLAAIAWAIWEMGFKHGRDA